MITLVTIFSIALINPLEVHASYNSMTENDSSGAGTKSYEGGINDNRTGYICAHAPKDSRESGEENEATSGVDETGSRSCQGATGTCPTGAQSVISLPQTSQTSNTLSPILTNQGFPTPLSCLIPSQNHQTLTFRKTYFF